MESSSSSSTTTAGPQQAAGVRSRDLGPRLCQWQASHSGAGTGSACDSELFACGVSRLLADGQPEALEGPWQSPGPGSAPRRTALRERRAGSARAGSLARSMVAAWGLRHVHSCPRQQRARHTRRCRCAADGPQQRPELRQEPPGRRQAALLAACLVCGLAGPSTALAGDRVRELLGPPAAQLAHAHTQYQGCVSMQGLQRYIRKKALDPLESYVPAVLSAKYQLQVRDGRSAAGLARLHACADEQAVQRSRSGT